MNLVLLYFRIKFNLIKFFNDNFHLILIQFLQVKKKLFSTSRLLLIYLALQIDSSAAFDRPIPTRGFRRWKTLPAIKDTVSSLLFSQKIDSFFWNICIVISSTNEICFYTKSHYFTLIFRVLTYQCSCQTIQAPDQQQLKRFLLRFFFYLGVHTASSYFACTNFNSKINFDTY